MDTENEYATKKLLLSHFKDTKPFLFFTFILNYKNKKGKKVFFLNNFLKIQFYEDTKQCTSRIDIQKVEYISSPEPVLQVTFNCLQKKYTDDEFKLMHDDFTGEQHTLTGEETCTVLNKVPAHKLENWMLLTDDAFVRRYLRRQNRKELLQFLTSTILQQRTMEKKVQPPEYSYIMAVLKYYRGTKPNIGAIMMCLKANVQLYKKLPFSNKKTISDAHRYAILFLCLKSYMNITFNNLLELMLDTVHENATIRENDIENVSIFNTNLSHKGKSKDFRDEFFKGLNMFIGFMYNKKFINLIELMGVPKDLFDNYYEKTLLSYQLQYLQSVEHVRIDITVYLCVIVFTLKKKYPTKQIESIIDDVVYNYNLPPLLDQNDYHIISLQLKPFDTEYDKINILIGTAYRIYQILSINSLGSYFLSLKTNTELYLHLNNTDDIYGTIDYIVVYIVSLKEHSSISLGTLLTGFQQKQLINKNMSKDLSDFKHLINKIFNDTNTKIKFYNNVERFLIQKYDKKYKDILSILNLPSEIENNSQYVEIIIKSLDFIRSKSNRLLPFSYIFSTIVYFYMKTPIPEFNLPYIVYNVNGTLLDRKQLEKNKLGAVLFYLKKYYNFPDMYYNDPVKIYGKISGILNDFVKK